MKKNLFTQTQVKTPPRSVFDLSHDVKQSMKMGVLYPTLFLETVPGDSFTLSCESVVRFAPMLAPIMHRINVFMHYFFVPNRLVWDKWEDYITGMPLDEPAPAFPVIGLNGTTIPSVETAKALTYFGLPLMSVGGPAVPYSISAIPFAAYQMIYNEYYRDQNLVIEDLSYQLASGSNNAVAADLFQLRRRAWEHDYLTSALPWAQKGNTVDIPLGAVALIPQAEYDALPTNPVFRSKNTGNPLNGDINAEDTGDPSIVALPGVTPAVYDPQGTLTVEATTINDLRRAFRLQEWFEKQARGGSWYIEVILSHFGIKSSDARLQRPEYITGTMSPVSISEVQNTAGIEGELPQGNLAGHAISVTSGNYGKYFCEEHGYIVGIMSVMPKTAYMNGIPKHFLKITDKFEIYWPEFANIGEQAIINSEVHWDHATPQDTFGYIPRYAEYKFINSRIAGDFASSLNYWTMARNLDSSVALNQEFIECTPTEDIFAVTDPDVDKLYSHIYHKIRAVRPMPFYGNPTF